jgi:hypothetical protein
MSHKPSGLTEGQRAVIRRRAARKATATKRKNGTFERIKEAEAERACDQNFPGGVFVNPRQDRKC